MKRSLLATLVLARCILADAQIRLFHRIYHPLEHQVSFSSRGSILVAASGGAHFHPSDAAPHDLLHFPESIQHLDGTLYQVALQRDSDPNDGHGDFSSVKAVRASSVFTRRVWPVCISSHFSAIFCPTLRITLSSISQRQETHPQLIISSHPSPMTVLAPSGILRPPRPFCPHFPTQPFHSAYQDSHRSKLNQQYPLWSLD